MAELNPKPQASYKGQLRLKVGRSINERRLDKYLHGRFSNFSRVKLQKIIKGGNVKVNNECVKASFKINPRKRRKRFCRKIFLWTSFMRMMM
ncbi:MAG: S4 domain-containing protein [Planctomycetota bacterium]